MNAFPIQEKIEILSVDLLDENKERVKKLTHLARKLRLELGWHYLLDLTWILKQVEPVNGKRIMDAGAGIGVMQWYLAQEGADVLSVDRESRSTLPLRFRTFVRVEGYRREDLLSPFPTIRENLRHKREIPLPAQWLQKIKYLGNEFIALTREPHGQGRVVIYNQDLTNLVDIPSASLDVVVAVSALEHNAPEDLRMIVQELMRVLKPGGALLATLAAAREEDWWHAASRGWCFSEANLIRLFDLPSNVPSNYDQYDELLTKLRQCAELRDNLARFYRKGEDKGMPRGVWDPQYQPVGVCKIKPLINE